MKVAVCIASHERPASLNIVLGCLPAHWHAVVVVSSKEDAARVMERPRTHVHIFANNPLGAKWQHAVDRARALDPDLLMITGSDDALLVDEPAFLAAIAGADFVGLNSFVAFDGATHYKIRYKVPGHIPLGGGRVYTRALLERMRWHLFDPTLDRKLDQCGYHNARRAGAKILHVEDLPGLHLVALKGPWKQMNSMDKLRAHPHILTITKAPGQALLGPYQF